MIWILRLKGSLLIQWKTPSKKLIFINLLGLYFPIRHPLYKNLFSLKFETGSYFLKSLKKFYIFGQTNFKIHVVIASVVLLIVIFT